MSLTAILAQILSLALGHHTSVVPETALGTSQFGFPILLIMSQTSMSKFSAILWLAEVIFTLSVLIP
jgi:hypothetical protein